MSVGTEEIRQCSKCGRRYILSKGFYKRGYGKYRSECKSCSEERESKKRESILEHDRHLYGIEDEIGVQTCKRCGVQRRKKANTLRKNWFVYQFRSRGKQWGTETIKCVKNENN